MRLHELAYCARVFIVVDSYDAATVALREATGPAVDPGVAEHRGPLFVWLRKWGCRQFKRDDERIARDSLMSWWERHSAVLPPVEQTIDELNDDQLTSISSAYDDLRQRHASWQQRSSGCVRKGFGPVGAAKTLYAIRPNACVPWDDPIKKHFALGDDGASYRRHLIRTREELAEAVRDLGPDGHASQLPALLERPDASPVKLVDEHDWVRFTRGGAPPSPETLRIWLRWASGPDL